MEICKYQLTGQLFGITIRAMKEDNQKNVPLYLRIRGQILETIRGMKPPANRLEPEEQLAARLGTSRATVRQAMDSLIREGYISRRQGKGNFGHPAVAGLAMRIDISSDFRRLISDSGGKVSVEQNNICITSPSERMKRRMPESSEDQVVSFDWIYRDGGKPVIICQVEVLRHLMRTMPEPGPPEPCLSDFLNTSCEAEITYTTTWLRSEVNPEMAGRLGVREEMPMVVWDEIFYDLHDRKICFNSIYFHPVRIDLSMLLTI
jgi:DNA-binding GntR family transcriptional regulator